MRIQSLTLKNFRSHQETVLELDRFNFIRGPNGCGKSSIQMALEFLFAGRCEMTDAAGRGAEDLIRSGAKELSVFATFENGETICRRRSARAHTVELNGKRVPIEAAQAHIEKRFAPSDVLSAVLNAGRFIEMPEAEQKKLLARVLDAGRIEIPDEVSDMLRAINEAKPNLASMADVEAAHKRFHELRTKAGRALKAIGQMEKPETPEDSPSSQEVKKRLDDLRLQKERIIAQSAEATTAWEAMQTRLRQVQAEMAEISAEILAPEEEQRFVEVASKRADAEKLRQELADLTAKQKAIETSIAEVEGLGSKCPRCRQPVSKEAQRKELDALRKNLADVEDLLQGAKEEVSEYAGIEEAQVRLERHRIASARRTKLEEEQSHLRGLAKPNTADNNGRLTVLSERINKGERVLESVKQAEAERSQCEQHIAEKSRLEARLSLLDRLVDLCGPNGAMMTQTKERVSSFTARLNEHLGAFGYACKVTLDPFCIQIRLPENGGFWLSLPQLSESERFRFGIAFQIALAKTTGLGLIVIDRADLLDKEQRRMSTKLLLCSGLDQAIVLATSEGAAPKTMPEDVKFLDLAGRTISNELTMSAA